MPRSQPSKPIEWVTKTKIRQQFNKSHIVEQAQSGQLYAYVKRSSHPNSPPPGEPYCTHSQILFYYTLTGQPIAVAHQYLRPDGTIGGSGRPDPKRLFLANKIMAVKVSN